MKISLLLSAVALIHQANCQWPQLEFDSDTARDCVGWYDNYKGETCESVRDLFGIPPEMFHKWNPRVGLDCKPWEKMSYCIVTQERIDDTAKTATTTAPTPTTTINTAPSPTSWAALGCYTGYVSNQDYEVFLSTVFGDDDLTIPKCKNDCYLRSYKFAAVQAGNSCMCGRDVDGEWPDQTECNIPCSGDKDTVCGGRGLANVFRAENNTAPMTTGTVASSPTQSSGAGRNRVMFQGWH
ncbi:hypothetical protein V494_00950 [Pseudogymnoascus sp. VKM F-4513 (FW-928)]|nr:hypothetical protein V494_00950 [Pseudogymnoascus sp. VKM F-4513 (FW-928)]